MNIGFSTGSLARGDFQNALSMIRGKTTVVELSALREGELDDLLAAIPALGLDSFSYVSFHAPSKLETLSEAELVEKLKIVAERGWYAIVHPNIITQYSLWSSLGQHCCIENMDKRKGIGRTAVSLSRIFDELPQATFCLDLAHARQVDPTMTEAINMALRFKSRLVQLHVSDLNSASRHERLNLGAIKAYHKVSHLLSRDLPIILETPTLESGITAEIALAAYIFDKEGFEMGPGKDLTRNAFFEYMA